MQMECALSFLAGNFHECCPVFISHQEAILYASGSVINVVSSVTGSIISSFNGHCNAISAIYLPACNSKSTSTVEILSASIDGTVLLWELKTMQVISSFKAGTAVYDIVITSPVIETGKFNERVTDLQSLVLITGATDKQQNKKKKFTIVDYMIETQQRILVPKRKLLSMQFPRRCIGVIQISAAMLREVTGVLPAMDVSNVDGVSANTNRQLVEVMNVLVVGNGRKITMMPYCVAANGGHNNTNTDLEVALGNNGTGLVVLELDPENRRGSITCIAVSSDITNDNSSIAEGGLLVTGHEKGHIVVWHNIAQYYINAVKHNYNQQNQQQQQLEEDASATTSVSDVTTTAAATTNSKKNKKSKKPHHGSKGSSKKHAAAIAAPVSTVLHWHAHPVYCLSLSSDGSTLYSGGEEGVLVVWHNVAATSSTGNAQSFYPRLGAPISHLINSSGVGHNNMSGIRVALTTTDNGVHIINTASMKKEWSVRSLCITSRRETVPRRKLIKEEMDSSDKNKKFSINDAEDDSNDHHKHLGLNRPEHHHHHHQQQLQQQQYNMPYIQSDNHWRCMLTVEPRTQWLVCNGYPGQLQAFDRSTHSLSHAYQVADYTRVSKKETTSKMYVPSIMHFQFLKHPSIGSLLATVDVRRGVELDPETSLKFWEYSDIAARYRLSAQMDSPHGTSKLTSLAFAGDCMYNSSSSDNCSGNDDDNTSAVAAVTCATASLDGTVKVWRAVRNDVPPQPTPATATNDAMMMARRNNSNNSSQAASAAAATAAGYIAPLKWICAYSFRYRESPASALSFSRDGSLLAVAHRNLLTLWDPISVTLKASFVSPVANCSVQFTAFIEPRASAAMGGGCGQALLFIASKKSLTVYDLLTMEVLWTKTATAPGESYTGFAVAKDEQQLLRFPSNNSSTNQLTASGWIAVSCIQEKSSNYDSKSATAIDDDDVITSANTDTEAAASNSAAFQHKVLLFDLSSSIPVGCAVLPAKATSMSFCSQLPTPSSNNITTTTATPMLGEERGLAVVLESSELVYLTAASAESSSHTVATKSLVPRVGAQAAQIDQVTVPVLLQSQVPTIRSASSHNDSSSSLSSFTANTKRTSVSQQQQGWLRDYFDGLSENIPALSVISAGFFNQFKLQPSTISGNTSSNSSNSTVATSHKRKLFSINNYKENNDVIATSEMVVTENSNNMMMNINHQQQQDWDSALMPFFVKSSSTHAAKEEEEEKESQSSMKSKASATNSAKKSRKSCTDNITTTTTAAIASLPTSSSSSSIITSTTTTDSTSSDAALSVISSDNDTYSNNNSIVDKKSKSKKNIKAKSPMSSPSLPMVITTNSSHSLTASSSAAVKSVVLDTIMEEEEGGDNDGVTTMTASAATSITRKRAATTNSSSNNCVKKTASVSRKTASVEESVTGDDDNNVDDTDDIASSSNGGSQTSRKSKTNVPTLALLKQHDAANATAVSSAVIRRSARVRSGSNLSDDSASVASSVASSINTRSTRAKRA